MSCPCVHDSAGCLGFRKFAWANLPEGIRFPVICENCKVGIDRERVALRGGKDPVPQETHSPQKARKYGVTCECSGKCVVAPCARCRKKAGMYAKKEACK